MNDVTTTPVKGITDVTAYRICPEGPGRSEAVAPDESGVPRMRKEL
jgi:hypothetical protein